MSSSSILSLLCQICGADNAVQAGETTFTCVKCANSNPVNLGSVPNSDLTVVYVFDGNEVGSYPLPLGSTLTAARSVDTNDPQDQQREQPTIPQGLTDTSISALPKIFSRDVNGALFIQAPANLVNKLFVLVALDSDQRVVVEPSSAEPNLKVTLQDGDHVFNFQ